MEGPLRHHFPRYLGVGTPVSNNTFRSDILLSTGQALTPTTGPNHRFYGAWKENLNN